MNSIQEQEVFRAFWSGPPLSAYEELSLRSVAGRGYRVLLYSYDKTLRVPHGIDLLPADNILPGPVREFVYPNGDRSVALHSDLFRYEILRRYGGWYFDLDVVLLSDRLPADNIFIARQDEVFANGAVMKFPPDSPLMKEASDKAHGVDVGPEWGSIGPRLLTRLINQHGLKHLLQPPSIAFPIQAVQVPQLFLPEHRERLEASAANASFLHLWNEVWRRARIPKVYGPPEGSFLDGLFQRFDIAVAPTARLSAQAVESWFREMHLVDAVKRLCGEDLHLQDATTRVEDALWERECMLQSTSWRITAPMRKLVKTVRR